ncbi:MAG: rRNA pseudouridine synthase [Clostridia bacterium]|nr:rRNA pseudouridine synthase [Clostridia bacterium]
MLRLDAFVAKAAALTRSEAQRHIRRGEVCVAGIPVKDPSHKINDADEVTLAGALLFYSEFVYLMMNKPAGVVCANSDARDGTVFDLIDEKYRRRKLHTVGRLDRDTTGLLLLTDDGDFTHRVASPSSRIEKRYLAGTDVGLGDGDVEKIEDGLTLDGRKLSGTRVERVGDNTYVVTVFEGRYHEVKRIFSAFGSAVTSLKRLSIGHLELDPGLAPGSFRELTAEEREKIL